MTTVSIGRDQGPMASNRPPKSPQSARDVIPRVPYRVLVVDDEEAVQDDFRKILTPSSAPTEALEAAIFGAAKSEPRLPLILLDTASQGRTGLELTEEAKLEGSPYAVAFVDIRMPPGIDGVETTAKMLALDPNLQIVICSAYSDYSWEEILSSVGQTDRLVILKKPFDVIEVRQLASALIRKWDLVQRLEVRVKQRTTELEVAAEKLYLEMQERLRVEQALRRAQKLEALGQLAASINHEINNPLSYIIGNLEFCTRELSQLSLGQPPELTVEIHSALSDAMEGAMRIGQIIQDVKLFARDEELPISAVDLREVIESSIKICRNQLAHRGRLVLDVGETPPVRGDARRLEQVIINLLINAAQALPVNGEDREIRIAAVSDQERVVVEIQDRGHGISPDLMEHVFDPFFTTKAAGEGTGLGLHICRNIVRSFGGDLTLHPRDDGGTIARIELLVHHSDDVEADSTRDAGISMEQKCTAKVLIIDDDLRVGRSIERALRDCETVVLDDAAKALALCRTTAFNLVLCDLMMPQKTGPEFYEELNQLEPRLLANVVFMTGGAFSPAARQFLARKEVRWVKKPLSTQQIRVLLLEYLTQPATIPAPMQAPATKSSQREPR